MQHATLIFVLTLTLVLSSSAAPAFNFPADGRFIVSASLGKELLSQRSRPTPGKISEFWEPSKSQIDDLEMRLVTFLEEREKAGKENPPRVKGYHRQYVGIVMHGERYIYGNFYPDDKSVLYDPRDGKRIDESMVPRVVCDGGPVFWGIVYRLSTKTFDAPRFNGVA